MYNLFEEIFIEILCPFKNGIICLFVVESQEFIIYSRLALFVFLHKLSRLASGNLFRLAPLSFNIPPPFLSAVNVFNVLDYVP